MPQPESKDLITIYTDGACSKNPGPGGWGAILQWREHIKELNGSDSATTNNRMELMAIIKALDTIKYASCIAIYTDSIYVKDGITRWIYGWKRNGWKTSNKKPIKNIDLWQQLDLALVPRSVSWNWVKGHSGNVKNERADVLAKEAIKALKDSTAQDS